MKTTILFFLTLLTLTSTVFAKGGVSSGGGGDNSAYVEVNGSRYELFCPQKGKLDCDTRCEDALQKEDGLMQATLDQICQENIFTN